MLNSTSGAQNAIANVSRTPGSPVRRPTRAQQRVIRAGAHGDEHGAGHWHARRCAGERVSVGREVACLGLRRVSPSLSASTRVEAAARRGPRWSSTRRKQRPVGQSSRRCYRVEGPPTVKRKDERFVTIPIGPPAPGAIPAASRKHGGTAPRDPDPETARSRAGVPEYGPAPVPTEPGRGDH